jgi:hypothetical protein
MMERLRSLPLTQTAFWGSFIVLLLLSLVPLWSVRVPPMQDIWQHLALVNVLHEYSSPGSIFPDIFQLPSTPKPNLIYYYGTHFLAYVTPNLETANKLVLSIYVLTFPVSFLYFLRSFGRSRWLAFFSFPFIYNAMFSYGFVSFILGMPLLFVAVGAYRSFVAPDGCRLDLRSGAIAAIAILLTFFTHAHIYLLTCLLCGILFLMHRDRGWGSLLRLAPFAPSLVFFVPWVVVYFIESTPSSSGMRFGSIDNFFGPTFYRPSEILGSFFTYVGNYFRSERDDALFLAMMLVSMLLLMLRRAPRIPNGETRKVRYYDLEVLTIVLAVSFVILPQHIESQSIVSQRHIVFAILFYFGWLGIDDSPRRIAVPAIILVMALHVMGVANLVKGFKAFEKELDGYPSLFDKTLPGKRLLKVTYNQESSVVNQGAMWHMHFFYSFQKGGVSDLEFAERPHNPIQYRPGMIPPLTGVEFTKNQAWRYYDYVLLRKTSLPPFKPVEDRLEVVSETSNWILYKATLSPVQRPPELGPLAKPPRIAIDSAGSETVTRPSDFNAGVHHAKSPAIDLHRALAVPRDIMRRRLKSIGDFGSPAR